MLTPLSALAAPDSVVAAQNLTVLAPGVTLTSFDRLYPFGWVKGHLLDADLSSDKVGSDLLSAGAVTAARPLTVQANNSRAIAAVNGDFFDINNTKAPLGPMVQTGLIWKSAPSTANAAGVGADRIGRVAGAVLNGQVTTPSGLFPLASMNQWTVPGNGIGLYTPQWTVARGGAAYGAEVVTEVVVKDGKVLSVAKAAGTAPAAAGTLILVGREEGAVKLAALKVGDPVAITYAPAPALDWAVGGGAVLLRAGAVPADLDDKGYKPRTAIGFSADGKRIFLVVIDGRSEASGGLTLLQLGRLMKELGAADALELDGGGSTEMVARRPGETQVSIINSPSDGVERPVPNGVGIFATPGSGLAAALKISPVMASNRVFPGLTRRVTVTAQDEMLGPAPLPGAVTWVGAEPAAAGIGGAVVRAPATATPLTVQAKAGTLTGTAQLKTLGPLERIEADVTDLRMAVGITASFRIMGYDAEGYSAPIEPADVTLTQRVLTVGAPALRITEAADGAFQVSMTTTGQATLTATVAGKSLTLPVAVGARAAVVTGFESATAWAFDRYPATQVSGSLARVPGRTWNGLRLNYSFTAGGTRAAYAVGGLALPGRPSAVGLWVYGDSQGAWLRAELSDAAGDRVSIDLAKSVTWTGWRYVEAAIPTSLRPPLKVERIYPVETNKDRSYSGSLLFDDLLVQLPLALPAVPPAPPRPADPMLATAAAAPGTGWPFVAVTGRNASREQIKAAAAQAEFVLLGGDAVTAYPGLYQEVSVPVYGLTAGTWIDQKGVRFIGLDTATGSLRTSNFSQLDTLRKQLDEAAANSAVKAVVLVTSAPPARYSDWREASLISQWLSGFRELSGGKPVTYLAGGGTSLVNRYEGVAYAEAAGGGGLVRVTNTTGAGWMNISPWR
ncbi:MAG: hypothetical protein K0R39_4039 [Symbiobacteriaceae bacterium]|jgi:hypothetical protein|nr:hypothetical protein [Symbiobacteriaceae bacterium]